MYVRCMCSVPPPGWVINSVYPRPSIIMCGDVKFKFILLGECPLSKNGRGSSAQTNDWRWWKWMDTKWRIRVSWPCKHWGFPSPTPWTCSQTFSSIFRFFPAFHLRQSSLFDGLSSDWYLFWPSLCFCLSDRPSVYFHLIKELRLSLFDFSHVALSLRPLFSPFILSVNPFNLHYLLLLLFPLPERVSGKF